MSLFTTKESTIEGTFVRRALAEHGVFAYKLTGIKGWPDRVMFLPPDGRVLMMEFKALRGIEGGHQALIRLRLAALGITVHQPRSVKEAMEILRSCLLP